MQLSTSCLISPSVPQAFVATTRVVRGLAAIACGGLLSWLIEWLQLWTPGRFGNMTDITANTGAYLAIRSGWRSPVALEAVLLRRWRLQATGGGRAPFQS